ncbi:MAG: sulfurtransferase [Burkholderiaceae bacterium]
MKFLSSALRTTLLLLGATLTVAASAKVLTNPVISASDLSALIDKKSVTVLDIRPLLSEDKKTQIYAAGHIPTALPAPYGKFRGPKNNPGQLPAEKAFSEFLSGLGVSKDKPIVVVGEGKTGTDFGASARVYWTLKIAGFQDLALLDGGHAAWAAAKRPLEVGMPTLVPKPLSVTFDRSQVVTVEQVKALTQNAQGDTKLLDARPEDFYKGDIRHPAAARWGTLPGANHFDSEEWFQPKTGLLKSPEAIRSIAQAKGLLGTQDNVSFCNTGHWAATNWFVLSELLGQSGTRLYPESMVAWSNAGLPMQNEPGRATVLMRQLLGTGLPK